MKRFTFLGMLAVLVCLSSCKKNKPEEVTYEVLLLAATTWHGTYLNDQGQVISVTGATNGWKHSFTNTKRLSMVTMTAYPDGTEPLAGATMRIYVNGKQVATSNSVISPQVQYQFP